MTGNDPKDVKRLIITASGGPFRKLSREDLDHVTKADALKHPNWQMGAKITIDSATMMNKGFEVIEAYHLFGLPLEKIDVVIHPGSIVHSMVEFSDHSVFAQMGVSDMRIPIQFALTCPHHRPFALSDSLDLVAIGKLEFEKLDDGRFPLVALAKKALRLGGVMPAVLNASNEAAVNLFLKDKISFKMIEEIITSEMNAARNIDDPELEDILETDKKIKEKIYRKYNG
jgi:1-deoxy-D-xylulose-5-phosphate reductoisomerase